MNPEKYNQEITRLDERIKQLTRKKKEAEGRKKAAADAELIGAFTRHHISPERYFIISKLSKSQMEWLISEAQALGDDEEEQNKRAYAEEMDEADRKTSFAMNRTDNEPLDITKKI